MNAIRGWSSAASGTLLFLVLTLSEGKQNRPPAATTSSSQSSAAEQLFFRGANAERSARGLPAYNWDETLAVAARKHALLMAKSEELSHQLPGEPPLDERAAEAGARFSSVGENVAIGTDAPGIQDGWMNSPGHRANILNSHFTAVGIAVVESDGELYAVEDFSKAVERLSVEQQEARVAALLTARGFHVTDDREEARRLCEDVHAPTQHHSMAILEVETPHLTALPKEIEPSLNVAKYPQAAVGACEPQKTQKGIARFRLAILLFPEAGNASR
jgi:uncharacterized protein YkwD